MGSIIFWATMVIAHGVNARVWKDEPKSFWYKASWFFLGVSAICLLGNICRLFV